MLIPLPYSPRKYHCEWLESLKYDSRIFSDEFLENCDEEYPSSMGDAMPETDWHFRALFDTCSALRLFFMGQKNVYIGANNFLYWDEGNKRACISPDIYVVKGVDGGSRRVYKTWEEGGAVPSVIFEFTSKSTKETDFEEKAALYGETLKVKEYFLFDPEEKFITPALQGFRLLGDGYQPMTESDGRLFSSQLGLELERDGFHIRFYDPKTRLALPFLEELAESKQFEADRAEAQERRAEMLEVRAEMQERKLEEEAQRADTETKRANALEAELAELRKLLNRKS